MAPTRLRIFVSSPQRELAQVRSDLKSFLLGDAALRRFVSEVFLFEDLPARDQRADEVYLHEVEQCDLYLGIFGYEYGNEDDAGISPTEREYDQATRCKKVRLIYVWGADEAKRHPKMRALVRKASADLIRRRVEDQSALTAEVYASLVDHLDRSGALKVVPFDTAPCEGATLESVSTERIDWFIETARRERGLPLPSGTQPRTVLAHLGLLDEGKPTNAAVLLFGAEPQRFHRPAETKCVHCHGTEYQRPFASLQIYERDLFSQADQTLDFVLSKLNRAVGTRAESITAPATYEIPPDAVAEAVVNALAHRDYHSNASVEVRLFADRLEVWNPGTLPGNLRFEDLRIDHASIPNNPRLAESLYLARYIEKVGSGTQKMIELCVGAGLPEPTFEDRHGFFVLTIWRDWLTADALAVLHLNDRQLQAIRHVKRTGRITNAEYRELTGTSERTALRELRELTDLGALQKTGEAGRGTYYELAKGKPATNPPNPPTGAP